MMTFSMQMHLQVKLIVHINQGDFHPIDVRCLTLGRSISTFKTTHFGTTLSYQQFTPNFLVLDF